MAIHGINANDIHEYICNDDPCTSLEDGATVFFSKPIPNKIITRITDQQVQQSTNFADGGASQVFSQRMSFRNRECFRFGITTWENLSLPDGTPIPFAATTAMEGGVTYLVVSDEAMDSILSGIIQEVGEDIWRRNTMTETQRKNLEALSSQLGISPTSNATRATTPTEENEDVNDPPSEETAEELERKGLPPGAVIRKATAPSATGRTRPRASGKTAVPAGSS